MIAGKASSIARLIALATIMHRDQAPEGAAHWCSRLLGHSRSRRALLSLLQTKPARMIARGIERLLLRGIVDHWMRRKREIDALARVAATDGFSQLLVLGGGLDTLAWRKAEAESFARIVSADHPATLAVIRRAVARPPRMTLAPLDLRDGIAREVIDALDPAADVLVVIEGVLMYLPEHSVERVLRQIACLPNSRVRLVASWMVKRTSAHIGFGGQSSIVGRWLTRCGEPMEWAATPEGLDRLFAKCGFASAQQIRLNTPQGDDSSGAGIGLPDERLVLAER